MCDLLFKKLSQRIPAIAFEALGHRRQPRIGGVFRPRTAIQYLWRFAKLIRLLRRDRPHCLYFVPSSSRWGHWRDVAMLRFVRPLVCRVVAHVHSGNFHQVLAADQKADRFVGNVDAFVFLAHSLSSLADDWIPPEKRHVVPNTIVESMQFSEEEIAEKLAARRQRRRFNVVFISNMYRSKGYRDLAEALCAAPPDGPWQAHFVGAWPSESDRTEFESWVAEQGKSDHFRIHGKVEDREQIKELLRDADVLALPTYYPVEAQPVCIIEALNASTPIIATRHASIPEYVIDDVNGYLVDKESPNQIAAALKKLTNAANWQEKAVAARASYLENFHSQIVSEALSKVLIEAPSQTVQCKETTVQSRKA
jgi:glycosyltransferase involved in cell wall biosynthesis